MDQYKPEVPEYEETESFSTATADFDLKSLVGVSIRSDLTSIWLSWEEVEQLSEFLRRHVGP